MNYEQQAVGIAKRAAILRALEDYGSCGALTAELTDVAQSCHQTVTNWLTAMASDGVVVSRLDSASHSRRLRWWLPTLMPVTAKPVPPGPQVRAAQGHVARISRSAPILRRDGVTVLPGYTHDPRYQVAPGERVVGGFATLGIGRYL